MRTKMRTLVEGTTQLCRTSKLSIRKVRGQLLHEKAIKIQRGLGFDPAWGNSQWQIRLDSVPSIVNLAMKTTSAEQIAS